MDKKTAITAVVSSLAGGLVGGIVTYTTVKRTFADRAQASIDEMKEHYRLVLTDNGLTTAGTLPAIVEENKPETLVPTGEGVFADTTPESVFANLSPEQRAQVEALAVRMDYIPTNDGIENPNRVAYNKMNPPAAKDPDDENHFVKNVFEQDTVDPGNQMVGRYTKVSGEPSIISFMEFNDETPDGYSSITMTYYEGDSTLADEAGQMIANVEYMVGERHLEMFGHDWQGVTLSENTDTVYVRNPKISADIEIAREPGFYQVEVLGMDIRDVQEDVTNGIKQGIRKMRDGD